MPRVSTSSRSASSPWAQYRFVPAMITGRSASRSSAAARSTPSAGGPSPGSAARAGRPPAPSPSMNTWSSGKSTKVGPGGGASSPRPARRRRGRGSRPCSAPCAADLVTGPTNGTWSISCSEPWPQRMAGARPPSTSMGELFCSAEAMRAHAVGHAGPRGQRAHAGLAGDLGPALGGERGGGLVADVDEVDALLAAAVVDREQVAAREREELRHARGLQPPGDEAAAVDLRALLDLGRHAERHASARNPQGSQTPLRVVEGSGRDDPRRAVRMRAQRGRRLGQP